MTQSEVDISNALKDAIDHTPAPVQRAFYLLLDELELRESRLAETLETKPTRVITNDHVKLRHEHETLLKKVDTIERERDAFKKALEKEKEDRAELQGKYDQMSKMFKDIQKTADRYKAAYEEQEEEIAALRKNGRR